MIAGLPYKTFITGTDTDVGKTYVICEILKRLNASRPTAEAIKPLVSGGYSDVELLHKYSAHKLKLSERYLHYYEPAIAPHIAAKINGTNIDFAAVVDFMKNCEIDIDHILIEGFGGWMAPISDSVSMSCCVAEAGLPVVLVVGMKLGCINHSLLTVEAIKTSGCEFLGWIANVMPPSMPYYKENISTITNCIGEPLATVF